MKDLFFIILVVFSSWTLISGALTPRTTAKNFQTGPRSNVGKFQSARQPAVSFSAGPAKKKCSSKKCQPDYIKKVSVNPTGGCPIINCIRKQKLNCPPVNCRRNQRKSYSGVKLANGCQEIKCVNNRSPPRAQRRRGKDGCPMISMKRCELPTQGYCTVPRSIYRGGRKCSLCAAIVKCNEPSMPKQCQNPSNCPSAKFNRGECAIPREDERGCKQCPIITKNCDQIGGVRNQLG